MGIASWGEYAYRVSGNRLVTPVIAELTLEPVAGSLEFRAGQYVLISDAEFRVPQRSYSVANAPRPDGTLSILVTLVPGGPTSTWAHGLRIGDEITVEGPFGTFVPAAATGPVLLLAAGSGLAPARALAEALRDEPSASGALTDGHRGAESGGGARDVTLFFSGRTDADVIDEARFCAWAQADPRFDYRVTTTRQSGSGRHAHVPELLVREFSDLSEWEIFAAGPPGFVTGCEAAALELGARPGVIHTEEFFTDPAPWLGEMPPVPEVPSAAERRPTD